MNKGDAVRLKNELEAKRDRQGPLYGYCELVHEDQASHPETIYDETITRAPGKKPVHTLTPAGHRTVQEPPSYAVVVTRRSGRQARATVYPWKPSGGYWKSPAKAQA